MRYFLFYLAVGLLVIGVSTIVLARKKVLKARRQISFSVMAKLFLITGMGFAIFNPLHLIESAKIGFSLVLVFTFMILDAFMPKPS